MFADILLPLAAPGLYTYRLPAALESAAGVGMRAVVPFGARRFYTGLIARLHNDAPAAGVHVKDVAELPDEAPVVLPEQLDFWQWLADYYLCTPGEVMKAALPAGLKLESETFITRARDFDDEAAALSERDRRLLALLSYEKGRKIADVAKCLGVADVLPAVRRLTELGAVSAGERLERGFRAKTETRVRLAAHLADEARLAPLLAELRRAPKQLALLTALLRLTGAAGTAEGRRSAGAEGVGKAALLSAADAPATALNALQRRGAVELFAFETGRLKARGEADPRAAKTLGAQQARALAEVEEVLRHKAVCLLHGVTSSGKTEVFIRLIEKALAEGRQVLYLLPEIALTTQITERLGRVFGGRMGVYHSKFSDAERVEVWRKQLSENPFGLILGVRSSLFLPFRRLGLVIIDEEHETSYKQQDPPPRYNARDAAVVLARRLGTRVVLGTATPSLESYRNARAGKYGLVEMGERFGAVELPEIVVENVQELRRKRLMPTPFSPRLIEEMRAALAAKEQVILFQNRRGYAPVLQCRTCGWSPRCTQCDVALTLHRGADKLVCHYCGTAYDVPRQCPQCEDTELRDFGYGTEKIEAAAAQLFPEARTARMDLDTTRSRTAYEKLIEGFARGDTDILIGTQMVTKGLDFERVRVVGIVNADAMLNLPDFRAHERAFQMMAQVAGRAGRRGRRGLVVLQTRQPDLPVVEQVVHHDYAAMFEQQMAERQQFRFAPLFRMIDIYLRHRHERVADYAAQQMAALLAPHFGADLLGPDTPAVARVQRLYIRKLVLKVRPELPAAGVRRTLLAARDLLMKQPAYKSLSIAFDVDPL